MTLLMISVIVKNSLRGWKQITHVRIVRQGALLVKGQGLSAPGVYNPIYSTKPRGLVHAILHQSITLVRAVCSLKLVRMASTT